MFLQHLNVLLPNTGENLRKDTRKNEKKMERKRKSMQRMKQNLVHLHRVMLNSEFINKI